ncbi:MAG: nuclear transport factor 2 family protein [Alphaproteobacteria bacterium]|nr:nuclear transport factor 2 family protein [Alphaproteobacteria bacterium]
MIRTLLAAGAAALSAASAIAQDAPGAAVEALYEVISGPVGEARDWDRFRTLFTEHARMTVVTPGEEGVRIASLSPEDYIERAGPNLVRIGFTETETRRRTYQYGEMATILSGYEGVRTDTGETIAVGINTLVLVEQDGAWKIVSIAWRPADEAWPVEAGFEAAE